jgi:hypothetical protein
MTDRTTLALAACQGMTDDDLAARGPGGFAKMIDRKRRYATAARALDAMARLAAARIKSMGRELEAAQAQLAALEQLDAPVGDTSQAMSMLAAIAAKPAAPGAQA